MNTEAIYNDLNDGQMQAVLTTQGYGRVIAGAGTGKTMTLACRVAHHIASGVSPERILLLTFARRAAAEMLRRVEGILRRQGAAASCNAVWGGTFHAVALRLLRHYGADIGLPAGFTIHDRSDAEDLIDLVRTELGLGSKQRRFPRKATCMEIYSRCLSSQAKLEDLLAHEFPWCAAWADELKQLFRGYTDRKAEQLILDYDDLLLYWRGLLEHPEVGRAIRARFDCVLVDEYQDTNALEAEILKLLRPDGRGLTVVGDDAQSIYSFRSAPTHNNQ